MNEYDFVL